MARTIAELHSDLEMVRLELKNHRNDLESAQKDIDYPRLIRDDLDRLNKRREELETELAQLQLRCNALRHRLDRNVLEAKRVELIDRIELVRNRQSTLLNQINEAEGTRKLEADNKPQIQQMLKMAKKLPAEELKNLIAELLASGKGSNAEQSSP